jgi:hypothetical protein
MVASRDVHRPRGRPRSKEPPKLFKEKSLSMSSGRYLFIVYVKLRVKKQSSIDRIIIVKRKPNFTISITKNYFK